MAGKNITDEQLESLLGLYQPTESPSKDYWNDLVHKSTLRKTPTHRTYFFSLSGGLAVAAALIVLILWPRSLDLSYEIAGKPYDVGSGGSPGIGDPVKAMTLTTSGETLVLSPGGLLQVSSRKADLFSKPGNQYNLTQGTLELDHHNSQSTFVLITPFGQITPLGTRLKISLEKSYQDLSCLEGKIEFTPVGGLSQIISPGETHRWPPESTISPVAPGIPSEIDPVSPVPQVVPPTERRWELPQLWEVSHPDPVIDMTVGGDRLWVSTKTTLNAIALTSGKLMGTWTVGSDPWVTNGIHVFSYRSGKLQGMDFKGRVLWETPAPPVAFGGMSLDQGIIYLPSADGTLTLWSVDQGLLMNSFFLGSGSYGVPLVVENSVYISTLDKRFLSLDRKTGVIEWSKDFDQRFVGDRPQVWGNLVLTGTKEGRILFFDRKNGELQWTVESGLAIGNNVKVAGDTVFIKTVTGTQRYLSSGKRLPWEGDAVMAVGIATTIKGENILITAEPQGVWIQGLGERKLILPGTLDSALWNGETMVLKTASGKLSLYKFVAEN